MRAIPNHTGGSPEQKENQSMETESFQVYRHSGKFYAHGPFAAVVAAVVAGFPLGYAYAYFMKWIPFIYLNFLVTLGYGFFFGAVIGALMKWGKVRNTLVVLVTSLVAGFIALYFSWNGHIHSLFPDAPTICRPNVMLNGMKALYREGSWGLHGSGPVTGIPLAIVWVVEAGVILGLTTATAVGMIASTPFCENAMCWLDKKRTINTLAPFTDPAQVAAIKSGDLRPLTQARPKPTGADSWTRLTLKYS
ncbi:MAG TPA: hypothetical protein VN281_02450, partial [Verrucomicrobiae bacterium]|nr:hypothetical protein [Verrucomicrobiae bacterium]